MQQSKIDRQIAEYNYARVAKRDCWVAAGGGREVEMTDRMGRRVLYCYNFATGRHAYLNLDNDMIMTDEEVAAGFPASFTNLA